MLGGDPVKTNANDMFSFCILFLVSFIFFAPAKRFKTALGIVGTYVDEVFSFWYIVFSFFFHAKRFKTAL